MKRNLVLLLFTPFFLFIVCVSGGCKKSSSAPVAGESYMHFKLNGVRKDYNGCSANFTDSASYGVFGLGIAGASSNDPSNVLSISLLSKTTIKQGAVFTAKYITGTYFTQGTLNYVSGSKGYTSGATIIIPNALVNVTITELGTTYIKGTFSGAMYTDTDNYKAVVYTVTEGEFNAQRF